MSTGRLLGALRAGAPLACAHQDGRHELSADVAPGVQVTGDRERLAQMLWNLLENAMNYTPAGGRIELRLQRRTAWRASRSRTAASAFSDEDLPHVFERFYRGQAARAVRSEGSGLGLAIVKYVAEAHGGSVSISSRAGEGTVAVADLPATSRRFVSGVRPGRTNRSSA